MRLYRRVDEHRPRAVLFGQMSRIEPAEGRADEAGVAIHPEALDLPDGLACQRRQRWARVVARETELGHVFLHQLRLVRLRRGVEAVEIQNHAATLRFSRSSSFSWIPPNPPLDITSTWSPAFASAATAAIRASTVSSQRARAPRLANTAAASHPSPAA